MPPCCLATGRWGAARRRLDTGIARDPALYPLPGLMKNRSVDMTKIKSLLQKRQTSLRPGHEWLTIVVLWFHWNVFILATATSTFEQRNSARNGSDRASDWYYQESTSCHMRKKSFFVPWTSFVKNFPFSIVLLKICEFVGLFEVFRPVIFIGTLCIFEYLRIRDWQPIRLNPNVVHSWTKVYRIFFRQAVKSTISGIFWDFLN